LKTRAREEAGVVTKFSRKEDGVGKHKGVEEYQHLDHRQQQPRPAPSAASLKKPV
jgi:hypothetical protein